MLTSSAAARIYSMVANEVGPGTSFCFQHLLDWCSWVHLHASENEFDLPQNPDRKFHPVTQGQQGKSCRGQNPRPTSLQVSMGSRMAADADE